MLDLRWLREEPDALDRALARRGLPPVAASLREQDAAIRGLQTELQERQARRNALSREIGRARAQGGDADALIEEVAALKGRIQADEELLRERTAELDAELALIPNILADDVPDGADESANVELRRWGEPPIHWYPCSHMGFLAHLPDAIARVGALVDEVDRETRV